MKNALEPEWEARFEPRSYGFRPGRACHDAIEVIFCTLRCKNPQRQWVLDADLAGAFDRIDHDLASQPSRLFPRQGAGPGVAQGGRGRKGPARPTEEGTPQGGVISPGC